MAVMGRKIVERIVRDEGGLHPGLEIRDGGLEPLDFCPGLGGHFRVINRNELVRFGELVVVFLKESGHFDDWCEVAVLSAQGGHPLGILHSLRVGKLPLYLAGAVERVGEAITKTQVSGVAGAASRVLVAYF